MNSTELWNKINEVKDFAVSALTDFIKNHIKYNINLMPYIEQGYCTNINIYGINNNGDEIEYNLDFIEVSDSGNISFYLSDNNGYNKEKRYIEEFETEELFLILKMLEDLFDSIEKYNLPILEVGKKFDEV